MSLFITYYVQNSGASTNALTVILITTTYVVNIVKSYLTFFSHVLLQISWTILSSVQISLSPNDRQKDIKTMHDPQSSNIISPLNVIYRTKIEYIRYSFSA